MSLTRRESVRFRPGPGAFLALLLCLLAPAPARAQGQGPPPSATPAVQVPVRVLTDAAGSRLQVDGRDFMVFGMNWDYTPIGENYMYNLWSQPDDMIVQALDREMPLLRGMGVNVIRQYNGVPPRWVKYIYEKYGIWTVINHPMGRYGFTVDGVWHPNVDYSDPRMRKAIEADVLSLVEQFRGVPGMLMWLLGNENNYGLSWSSFEIEALPKGEQNAARARYLYSMMGETIRALHAADPDRPVSMANGDVQYIDLIAEECKGLDVFGTNCYRGISARDLFQVVHDKMGIPVMFTEFGSDAFNARTGREDQPTQARYLIGQWREIYEQSAGKGRVGNAIGGMIFQWSDGWWKYGQDSRLDVHDTHASWPNGGYAEDYREGDNNMNEEWWGICAKGPADDRGLYNLYPRAAYYALRRAFALDPYAPGTDLAAIAAHFGPIDPAVAALEARGDEAAASTDVLSMVRVSGLRLEFETYNTGGENLTTPPIENPQPQAPSFTGFDVLESAYATFEAKPTGNVTGMLSLNVLGTVARNPIDEIFYENRGRPKTVTIEGTQVDLGNLERVKIYRAGVTWDDRWFSMNAFYRTGHYHWGYEGDFFGMYREANYGENVDIYNGEAPVGMEVAAHRELEGLKVAFGQQLWWGANPAILLKYQRKVGAFDAAVMYEDDFAKQNAVTSTIAIPLPPTRKASVYLKTARGPWGFEVGGIWSGSTKVDQPFQIAEKSGDSYVLLQDYVRDSDALGAKAKVTLQKGRWNWYGQGAIMGLVADGGPTGTTTYTGWSLKDTGSGNQSNFLTGLAVNLGQFQVAPNFLWQKPIVGPVPGDVPAPGRPRNVLDDPFAVRGNRETTAGEIMLCYDPTPATWMWAWDNDVREDAKLAASLNVVLRHQPTTQDASIGILADGRTTFPFPGAPPPRDLWEVRGRVVSRLSADRRLTATAWAGTAEANGYDPVLPGESETPSTLTLNRLIHRYGLDGRMTMGSLAFESFVKIDDWGPYDYHRDFNLTFPLQLMGDVSYSLGHPRWFDVPQTRIGVRGTWRSLDENSNRYVAPADGSGSNGEEWEIRTYLHLSI